MDIARPFEAFLQEILLENSLRFFVFFFGFGVDSIWNILNHLDAIFEQTFSRIERIKIKKGALKLFYRFQTFKQQWNILLEVRPQGNIAQFGYNLPTTVDCQAETPPG